MSDDDLATGFPDVDASTRSAVYQHIGQPERVIREIARVLRTGGRLLAYDNDWGSIALSSTLREVTGIIQARWARAFTNPWIGRNLPRDLLDAGFLDTGRDDPRQPPSRHLPDEAPGISPRSPVGVINRSSPHAAPGLERSRRSDSAALASRRSPRP
ncbi:methyltransferase domain-containing protein [Thiocapsa rosea]|uniref:methyltransferase domain-containing protein n=1 Tax=Thiocapsa rosea TaxID=69360 RepID=UPI000EB3BE41